MNDRKAVHFMHIPKTGGTSLYQFLEKQFKVDETCPFFYLRYAANWIPPAFILNNEFPVAMNEYRFFKGHLGWVPRTYFKDDEIETITFLRDPIARSISIYNAKHTHIHRHYISKHWTCFDDFIEDKTFGLPSHSNIQTKHFCADLYFKQSFSSSETNRFISGTGGIFSNIDLDITLDQQLQLAIERLHRCAYIGITEHYEESFEWLCLQYGWLPPKISPKRNVSVKFVKKSDLSPKNIDKIIELNQHDRRLYQEAIAIFNDRKKTRVLCTHSDIIDRISEKPAKSLVKFTFADKLIGEGWGAREGSLPNVYCWSVDTHSTLIFSIKKHKRLHLSFQITHWLLPQLENNLTLTINSLPIPLTYRKHPREGIIFSAFIPSKAYRDNHSTLELSFTIPQLVSPKSVNEKSTDNRKLGFTCREINITPLTLFQYYSHRIKTIWSKHFDVAR